MVSRIEWHPDAIGDLRALGTAAQRQIRQSLDELAALDDPRTRLVAYGGALKGFWKLRKGDYRLVCRIENRSGRAILVILVAHRSMAYSGRNLKAIDRRSR